MTNKFFRTAPEARSVRLYGGTAVRAAVTNWRPRLVSRLTFGPLAYLAPTIALRRPSAANSRLGGLHGITPEDVPTRNDQL